MLIYCTLQIHVQQATYANELHVNVQHNERCFVWTALNDLITGCSAVVAAKHLIDGSWKHICRLSFEF